MRISRPGDEVRLGDRTATIVAVTGPGVQLRDIYRGAVHCRPRRTAFQPGFPGHHGENSSSPPSGLLDGIPEGTAEKARWWERHIAEVLTRSAPGKTEKKAEYDPLATTLRQRELAKIEELRSAGHQVALRTFQRMRRNYEDRRALGSA